MAPKKRPTAATSAGSSQPATSSVLKYRPFIETGRWASKGTKPLPEPITVPEIFTKVILHGCKKVLFLNPKIRLTAYAVLLFFASLVADYMPFPKTYFANSGNIPNQYFVKFSWAWTFMITGMFMFLTSSVYCCGDRKRIMRHLGRLLAGTIIWFVWTGLFRIIEETTGQCLIKDGGTLYSMKSRRNCAAKGGKWTSFDISGHAFLLIWCTFFIIEEAKVIVGWDGIKDFIRNEDHNRSRAGTTDLLSETPLCVLTEEEFQILKMNYAQYSTFAKVNLILMTVFTVLWDIMIFATAIYFHVMIEKVIGGLIAVLMWLCMYKGFYHLDAPISPGLPGVGIFKYSEPKVVTTATKPSISSTKPTGSTGHTLGARQRIREADELPKFLGMPLYALKKKTKEDLESDLIEGAEGTTSM